MTEQDRPDTSDDNGDPSEKKTAAEAPAAARPVETPAAEPTAAEKTVAEKPTETVVADKPVESPVAAKPAESPVAEKAAEPPSAESPSAAPAPAAPAPAKKKRLAVLLGVGAGVLALVALALTAFVWPGFLAGPGTPDEVGAAATTALGSKNSAGLDSVSCRSDDGKVIAQLPQEAFQLVQSAKVAGPPTLLIDTQAQQPIDLVLTVQGQSQNVPANVILGVNDGDWCVLGLSMR